MFTRVDLQDRGAAVAAVAAVRAAERPNFSRLTEMHPCPPLPPRVQGDAVNEVRLGSFRRGRLGRGVGLKKN